MLSAFRDGSLSRGRRPRRETRHIPRHDENVCSPNDAASRSYSRRLASSTASVHRSQSPHPSPGSVPLCTPILRSSHVRLKTVIALLRRPQLLAPNAATFPISMDTLLCPRVRRASSVVHRCARSSPTEIPSWRVGAFPLVNPTCAPAASTRRRTLALVLPQESPSVFELKFTIPTDPTFPGAHHSKTLGS